MKTSEANYEAKRYTAGYIHGLLSDDQVWQQFFGDKSEKDQERLRKAFEALAARLQRTPTPKEAGISTEQVKESTATL